MLLIITTGIFFLFLPDTVGFELPRDLEEVKFMMENSKPLSKFDFKGWNPARADKPKKKNLES